MTNNADIRKSHRIVINAGGVLTREQINFLRSMLPPLPKQKTLEELTHDVYDVWAGASGNEWPDDVYGDLETWLDELHTQMQGLKDVPANTPALPDGMRLADHEQYGRVVTSPKPNRDGVYDLLVSRPKFETGADWDYAHECELTFIDPNPRSL